MAVPGIQWRTQCRECGQTQFNKKSTFNRASRPRCLNCGGMLDLLYPDERKVGSSASSGELNIWNRKKAPDGRRPKKKKQRRKYDHVPSNCRVISDADGCFQIENIAAVSVQTRDSEETTATLVLREANVIDLLRGILNAGFRSWGRTDPVKV